MKVEISLLFYVAVCLTVIFANLYGIYLLFKKMDVSKEFVYSLFSNDPKTPSTTKFVFIFSGILSSIILWGTWAYCQVFNMYNTTSDDVVTLVEIPTGLWTAYLIALCGPGAIKVGQSIWGKSTPCPPAVTNQTTTQPATVTPQVKAPEKEEEKES